MILFAKGFSWAKAAYEKVDGEDDDNDDAASTSCSPSSFFLLLLKKIQFHFRESRALGLLLCQHRILTISTKSTDR